MRSTQSDDSFREWLAIGQMWERRVCGMLIDLGIPCRVPEQRCRPSAAVRSQYRDRGDLILDGGRTLGVKARKIRFGSDPASFPPDADLMVGAPDYWEQANPKPIAFVIASRHTGALLVVPASTRPMWWVAPGPFDQVAIHVPPSTLRPFTDLVDYLRRKTGQASATV